MPSLTGEKMFPSETVTVWHPTISYDERMDPVITWEPETVEGMLFDSPTTEDVDETMRAFGVRAAYRMHVPKTYTASLRGCKVTRARDGQDPPEYFVAGDPQALPWSPQPWNRAAIVGWVDG